MQNWWKPINILESSESENEKAKTINNGLPSTQVVRKCMCALPFFLETS